MIGYVPARHRPFGFEYIATGTTSRDTSKHADIPPSGHASSTLAFNYGLEPTNLDLPHGPLHQSQMADAESAHSLSLSNVHFSCHQKKC